MGLLWHITRTMHHMSECLEPRVVRIAHWMVPMDWAEWVWRRERDALWARIQNLDLVTSNPSSGPVVLEAAREVEIDSCSVAACRRVYVAALGTGWTARITRALAAVPRTGLLETYAVRARRHDERLWACWWNGAFEAAAYWSPSGIETLAGERMSLVPPAVTPVDAMTVPQIKSLAVDRGIKIPSKFKRAQVIEHVKAAGLTCSIPPPQRRGVLDAVEGIRLTRHVVSAP